MIGYLTPNYPLVAAFRSLPPARTRRSVRPIQGIFKMAPIHHHFELLGWSESKVIVRFWIASLIFALFALTTLKLR